MKKLALLGIAGVLAACGVVEVKLVPPTLTNFVQQGTYCTDRDTILDFKFNLSGLLTGLQVWLVPADFTGSDPSKDPRAVYQEVKPFDLGNGLFKGYILLDSDANPGIQRLNVSGQAVKVSGGVWQVYARGYNAGETKGFVQASTPLKPATGPSCDPIFPYDNP